MKKFICGLLTVLLIILFSTLIFSFNFKNVVVNTISSMVVKKEIASNINDIIMGIYDTNDVLVLETIEERVNDSKVVDDITEKYFDQFINYVNNDGQVNITNIDSDIERLIDENKDALVEYGIEITDEDKQEIINSFDLDDRINDEIEEVMISVKNEMTGEERLVIDIYNVLTSSILQIGIIVGIVVDIILIALIKKSLYKWIFNVGIALICVGVVSAVLMPLVVNIIRGFISVDITIDISGIVTSGYIGLGIGILLIVVYNVIKKIK